MKDNTSLSCHGYCKEEDQTVPYSEWIQLEVIQFNTPHGIYKNMIQIERIIRKVMNGHPVVSYL